MKRAPSSRDGVRNAPAGVEQQAIGPPVYRVGIADQRKMWHPTMHQPTFAQDPDELFDGITENRLPTGVVKRRADVHRDGD